MTKEKQVKTFGERAKRARMTKGMSQLELANAIGRNQVSISNMERSDVEPSYEQLKKIASVLDVSTSYLLGEDEPVKLVESFRGKVISGDHESTMPSAPKSEASLVIENVKGDSKTRIEIPSGTDAALVLEILKFMQDGRACAEKSRTDKTV